METFFHISPIYNRNSILKHGIIPSRVKLNHHLDSFKEDGLLDKNEDRIIYFFEDSINNEKNIKDAVFCKIWIHPRNNIFNFSENEENWTDYSKYKNTFMYKYNQMIFDIYEVISIKEPVLNYRPYHEQIYNDDKFSTLYNMNDDFAHNDKILAFSKTKEKNIKIVDQVFFEYTNKKYNIKLIGNNYK